MPTATQRLRVEDLARQADLSVDTIRFYQKRRLLPPPLKEGRVAWYCSDHLARIDRIRSLQAQGFSLAVIRRIVDGQLDATDVPLVAAVAHELDDDADHRLSADQLAERAGVSLQVLDAVISTGLLARRGDHFSVADVALLVAGRNLLDAGLPLGELLELARRQDDAARDIARAAVELFDRHVRRPLRASTLDDSAKSQQLVEAFQVVLPATTELVAHHFRRVLLEVAHQHVEAWDDTL